MNPRDWMPPAGLSLSRPRPVRLTRDGKAPFILAVALWVGAWAGAIVLGAKAGRQADQQRLLRDEGTDTDAAITALWQDRGESRQPWVAYRFTAQGRTHERQVKAPLRMWSKLQAGSPLPVRYRPSNPDLSHPRDWTGTSLPGWIPFPVAAGLALMGWLATLPIRRERRLLVEGRAAPGRVTHYTKTDKGVKFHYQFTLLTGVIAKGVSGPRRKPLSGEIASSTTPKTRAGTHRIPARS